MQNNEQIALDQDKQFTTFLWLLTIATLYYLYAGYSIAQYIPFGKGLAGVTMLVSEMMLVILAVRTYKEYHYVFNRFERFFIIFTLLYNVAHIIYATIWDTDMAYMSLFGNPWYQPTFMLPIAFVVGLRYDRLLQLHRFVWGYVILLIINFIFARHINVMLGTSLLFLLAFGSYLPNGKKGIMILALFIYVILSYRYDARTAVLRSLMGVAIFLFSYTSLYKSRIIKVIIFAIGITLPLYFLGLFVLTGYSVFDQSLASSYMSDFGADKTGDTRTFLYEEVIEDLTENDALILGKGINGTYYSSYFDDKYSHEGEIRFIVEVGGLVYLLKGGLVQVILYMFLLIMAIYKCLLQSNAKFGVLLGLVLLSRYVLLFIEDMPIYDFYNIVMWLYIGFAFSITYYQVDDDWFEEQFNNIFTKS